MQRDRASGRKARFEFVSTDTEVPCRENEQDLQWRNLQADGMENSIFRMIKGIRLSAGVRFTFIINEGKNREEERP